MELAQYILTILRSQIFVLFSWGFHRPVVIENGLAFQVQGFLFTGRVEVIYDEGADLFNVRLINPDRSVKQEEEGVYADGLVEVIDGLMEKCPNYEGRVKREYGV